MAVSFKGAHFPQEIILTAVRWYIAYPLSTRHVEELMRERGVHVDHSTVNRWVIKHGPPLEEAWLCRKFCSGGPEGAVAPIHVGITRRGSRIVRPP
jgi:putative transposase